MELIRLFGSDGATAEAPLDNRAPRLEAAEAGFNREVKLSPGGPAELLNVSESGALVEGKTRLSTGSKVVLTLTGREQKRLSGRVVRCQVCAIHRDGTMTYQTALSLDQPAGLEMVSESVAEPVAAAVPVAAAETAAAGAPGSAAGGVNGSNGGPVPAQTAPPAIAVVAAASAASAAPRLVNQW